MLAYHVSNVISRASISRLFHVLVYHVSNVISRAGISHFIGQSTVFVVFRFFKTFYHCGKNDDEATFVFLRFQLLTSVFVLKEENNLKLAHVRNILKLF